MLIINSFLLNPPLTFEMGPDSWTWALSILSILRILLVKEAQTLLSLPVITGLRLLVLSLLACFNFNHIFIFYLFFELRALIVFFFILGFGYQPERTIARMFLIMFTILSSLPLFIMILILWREFGLIQFTEIIIQRINSTSVSRLFLLMLILGFLVKFPIYFFHIWLPKAHVEASAGGSIILAGVLLKLGSYGLFRVLPLLYTSNLISFIFFFSLIGGRLIRILCIRLTDLKLLIAYSSVAHISLVIRSILRITRIGNRGALFIRLAHGITSSALFYGVGLLYNFSGSRIFFFNRRALSWGPWLAFFWFIFRAFNIGTPPTFNFWAEILMLFTVINYSWLRTLPVGIMLFCAVLFRIILYTNLHAQKLRYEARHNLLISSKTLIVFTIHLVILVYITFFIIFLY